MYCGETNVHRQFVGRYFARNTVQRNSSNMADTNADFQTELTNERNSLGPSFTHTTRLVDEGKFCSGFLYGKTGSSRAASGLCACDCVCLVERYCVRLGVSVSAA